MRKDLVRFFALLSAFMVVLMVENRKELVLVCIDGGIAIGCLTFAVIAAGIQQDPYPVRK